MEKAGTGGTSCRRARADAGVRPAGGRYIFGRIIEAVQKGEEVSLFGFATFRVVDRAARKGRNPRTGEPVKVPASKAVKFVPSGTLNASVNKKRRARKA